jgi:hypothetical protein
MDMNDCMNADQAQVCYEALASNVKVNVNVEAMFRHAATCYYAAFEENASKKVLDLGAAATDFLVTTWELSENDSKDVLAMCRQRLSRASKAVHKTLGINEGSGLKVVESKLVLAEGRARKSNELLDFIKAWDKEASDENRAKMLEAVKLVAGELAK